MAPHPPFHRAGKRRPEPPHPHRPLHLVIALHGFIVGQPFRLRPLRQAFRHCAQHKMKDQIWFTRAGEIAKYCYSMKPGILPGS